MLKQSVICRLCVARAMLPKYQWRWIGSKSAEESPLRRLVQDAADFGEGRSPEPELCWATEPYAARPADDDEEGELPQHTTVLLFPGQGAQRVGMGALLDDVPAARDLYDLASTIVGWDVRRVCRSGPARELDARGATAVMVTSLAALEAARERRPAALERARAAAGLGVGELAALVWAGALPLEPALRLAEVTSAAAGGAGRAGGALQVWLAPGARLPALLAAAAAAADTAERRGVCHLAQYLYPGCRVLAGDDQALKFVEARGAEFGVRRAARVRGPGAYHAPLAADAERALRAALAGLEVRAPRLRVMCAADARRYGDAAHVRRQLARHLARPVRWEQTLHALYARPRDVAYPLTLVLGPGAALRDTLRQVNARAWDASVQIDV